MRAAPARRTLLLAGLVVAAGIASVGVCAGLLGGGPPLPVTEVLVLAPLVLAAIACCSVRACRAATVVFVAAADFAALAVAVDLGLLLMLLVLGRVPAGTQRDLVDAALLGVLLVAVLSGPLGRRAGRSARAALRGVRRTPDELLAEFADQSGPDTRVEEQLRRLAESMRRDGDLSAVRIWSFGDAGSGGQDAGPGHSVVVPAARGDGGAALRFDPDELELLGRVGVAGNGWLREWLPRMVSPSDGPAPQLRIAPAVHGGRTLGLLLVERPADAVAFSAADERMLAEVARRLGIVLRNRALDEALQATLADLRRSNAALQASRTRLVTTADAERRRIERDLHDGAQQHLVALAVGLRLLRDVPPGAGPDLALLDELDTGIRDAVRTLRELAHGIYPPLLRDAGLVTALRAAAKRSPLAVTVTDTGGVGELPEPVQSAVYFCCVEALQNAAKHAAGAAVVVTLGRDGSGALRFEVADDGPGFDIASAGSGTGLQNMSDRVGAIGGTVELRSTPGAGTVVAGRLPVAAV
ncbi:GAF domain-containing sensor histidine kinase [Pseudonocardia sp. GCM10023141]|uniref:GAF domain-containing sensor histidine kinase n=1 Tax=Pseudonocardia sp. GCM10023141 TaxID=3252653 RepID=UPI00361E842B